MPCDARRLAAGATKLSEGTEAMQPIPLVDLSLQHRQIVDEIEPALREVMASSSFILGQEVAEFEREFAAFSGVPHCIGVGSGTDALECALRAIGVVAGDEVLVPANTFIATPLAVLRIGAIPVLVDCDPRHYLIDVERVAEKITARTGCIVPVHLYGQMAPVEALSTLAAAQSIPIVEDAAQAHGARSRERGIGYFGEVAGVSFYPGKNLGAYGDAGAVLTRSTEVAERIRRLRNLGSDVKYEHPEIGFNSRLDTLQAVVLRAKLRRLATWNDQRCAAAAIYGDLLRDVDAVETPTVAPGNSHVYHLYVVRVPERDKVLHAMQGAGVGASVHYPVPVHLQGAMRSLGHREGDFPVSESAARSILSLPIYPGITRDQQQRVVETLVAALGAAGS